MAELQAPDPHQHHPTAGCLWHAVGGFFPPGNAPPDGMLDGSDSGLFS